MTRHLDSKQQHGAGVHIRCEAECTAAAALLIIKPHDVSKPHVKRRRGLLDNHSWQCLKRQREDASTAGELLYT
jgi:hypothetical protein